MGNYQQGIKNITGEVNGLIDAIKECNSLPRPDPLNLTSNPT